MAAEPWNDFLMQINLLKWESKHYRKGGIRKSAAERSVPHIGQSLGTQKQKILESLLQC